MTTQMTTQIKTLDDKPTDNPDANPDKKTRWQHYMAAQIYTSWLSFGLSSYANPDKKKTKYVNTTWQPRWTTQLGCLLGCHLNKLSRGVVI
jgi:hypothetical protein